MSMAIFAMASAHSLSSDSPRRPRLLVVDDEPAHVRVLHQIFQADHEVFGAISGRQALEICGREPPDLILLDVMMPGMDGFEVCAILKARPKTAQVPIIFVTSHTDRMYETRALELGAIDFIHKPISPPLVRARVCNYLAMKQVQTALLDSQERLLMALSAAEMATWDWNIPNGSLLFSARWAEMLGYTLEELPPRVDSWETRVFPDDLPQVKTQLARHFKGATPIYQSEHRVRHKEGHWVWVQGVGKVVERDNTGNPLRAMGTALDITDRKQTEAAVLRSNAQLEAEIHERKAVEAALRKSQESLRRERDFTQAVIDGLPGIFYVITTEGRFALWNIGLERVSGYSTMEIGGMNPLDFFENEERSLVARKIRQVFVEGSQTVEASLVTRHGKRIPYYFTGQRLDTGADVQLIGVGIDISARRQLEQALRHSNQELGRFADIAAHHLMEPARRLVSFSQTLRAHFGCLEDPEALIALNFIEDQAKRLRVLLRDVQLYLVADRPLTETETVDAERIAHAAVAQLFDTIQEAAAIVTVGKLPPVLIDAPRLSNLFGILLTNALRYRRLNVPTVIRIDGCVSKDVVQYWVADNGLGIPAEYRERVFQVFERLHPRTDSDIDSTGIGLSIVRRIVATRGGRTWIEETPGGGTTVMLELPAEPTAPILHTGY